MVKYKYYKTLKQKNLKIIVINKFKFVTKTMNG